MRRWLSGRTWKIHRSWQSPMWQFLTRNDLLKSRQSVMRIGGPQMAEIHESISVNARAERVFDIVDDEQKYPSYVPNVTGVADVVRSQGRVRDSVRIIYKVLGVTFDEKFTVEVHQRPSRIGSTFKGAMTGTFDWRFEPAAGRASGTA